EESRKEALRRQLLARSQELTEQIQRLRPDLAAMTVVGDSTDAVQTRNAIGTAEELIRLTDRELSRVISAMDDLAAGRYGQCIECDEEIAPKRLEAVPGANRCCQCQDKVDAKTSRKFGSARIPFYCLPQRP
ncbi:MAG: TraR/DksA family transcriptional regulator, partial [Patescibacteria group bacterium]